MKSISFFLHLSTIRQRLKSIPLILIFLRGKEQTGYQIHFAFETEDAPKALHSLSSAAGLPKERAVLSFLLAGPTTADRNKPEKAAQNPVRVVSDAFSLPQNCSGRYGCSALGLVLLTGDKASIDKTASGALVNPEFNISGQRDIKSGAMTAKLKN